MLVLRTMPSLQPQQVDMRIATTRSSDARVKASTKETIKMRPEVLELHSISCTRNNACEDEVVSEVTFLWQPLVDREGALEPFTTQPRCQSEQHPATTTAGKPFASVHRHLGFFGSSFFYI
jgi:hypothetical protein